MKWLILINAGMLLLMTLLRAAVPQLADPLFLILSLIPQMVTHGWLTQLVTYSFLHLGIWHLLGNMFGLWMFGSQFEMDWGRKKFLEFYFFCVVGAALTTVLVSYTGIGGVTPRTVTVGASGGVFGILLAFGMIYGDREVFLFPFPFSMKAKYLVGGWIFITLISAISASTPGHGGGVAYMAHLGGLLFGFLYVKFVPKRGMMFGFSERYFGLRNSYYRWKRRRAARKFEVYMRKHDREVTFDEHGNYIPPDEPDKHNGGSKSGWVN